MAHDIWLHRFQPNRRIADVALCILFALAGCSAQKQAPEEYIQAAKDLRAQGKYKEAQIQLHNVLQQQPNHPQANWLLAETYLDLNNPYLAETALRKAQEVGVSAQVLKYQLAQSLLAQGKTEEALKTAEPGIDDTPDQRLKLLSIQGEALISMGKLEDGCARYTSMRQLKTDSILALLGLARCAGARQDFAVARSLTQDALRVDPRNPDALIQQGHIERGQNHFAEAETAYSKALQSAPHNIDALLGRAMTRLRLRNFDAAHEDIKFALAAAPSNPFPTHLLGVEAHLRQQHKEAKIHFQRVLKVMPGYLPSLYWQAVTDLYLGNTEQSVKALSQYVNIRPGDLMAKVLLAAAEARSGNKISAQESLKALKNLGFDDPAILGLAGQTYLSLGKSIEAQRYLRIALDRFPKDYRLKLALAESYRSQNQYDAYAKEMLEIVPLQANSIPIRGKLVEAYLLQGNKAKARVEIMDMQRLFPSSAQPWLLLASMQLQAQDWPGARSSFEQMLKLDANSVDANMNLARLDLRVGKVNDALNRFLSVLKRDDKNMSAMMGIAGIAYALNDLKTQRTWLEKAIKTNPKALAPVVHLAQNLLATDNKQQALAIANQAYAMGQNNPSVIELLGDIQLSNRDYANARNSFSRAADLKPNSETIQFKLGQALGKSGLDKEARMAIQRAISLNPKYLAARLALAHLNVKEGHFREAHDSAAAIKFDYPKKSAGYMLDGEIYLAEKKLSEARKQFEQGMGIQPTPILLLRTAYLLESLGEKDVAITRLQQWLKTHPGDQLIQAELAGFNVRTGNLATASSIYESLLRQSPNQPTILNDLAWLQQKSGNPKRALTLAEQAYKLAPNNSAILDTLGWILVQQGQIDRGNELLAKAAKQSPDSPLILYHHAVGLARAGNKALARSELKNALQSEKSFSERREAEALLSRL